MPKAIILIDSEKIRNAHLKKCKDAQKQLEKNQHVLSHYRDVDQPAYISWMSSEFGDLLSAVRTLIEQSFFHDQLLREIEYIRYTRRISYRLAYEIVLEERELRETSGNHDSIFDEIDEDTEDDRNSFHEHSDQGAEEFFHFKNQPPKRKYEGASSESHELKTIFRDFAKKLHPDVNSDLSARDKDLWHEVLVAYEQRDLTRLQALQAFKETKDAATSGSLGIGDLQKIYKQVMKNVRVLQKEIKSLKLSPDWNFKEKLSSGKGIQALKREIRAEMMAEKFQLELHAHEVEDQLERWKKAPKQKNKPAPKTSARLHKF